MFGPWRTHRVGPFAGTTPSGTTESGIFAWGPCLLVIVAGVILVTTGSAGPASAAKICAIAAMVGVRLGNLDSWSWGPFVLLFGAFVALVVGPRLPQRSRPKGLQSSQPHTRTSSSGS